jgi:glycosyl transferase family 25
MDRQLQTRLSPAPPVEPDLVTAPSTAGAGGLFPRLAEDERGGRRLSRGSIPDHLARRLADRCVGRSVTKFPVWLINLDRADVRRQKMETQLAGLNLTYRRFAAIDGRDHWETLRKTVDIAAFERNVGRPVLPGEIGATHSHLKVWKELVQSGAEFGLVLEDDVVFHAEFSAAIDAAIAAKDQWDFLKLNKIRAKLPIRQGAAGNWVLNAYLGPSTGLGAYLIKAELADRLIPQFTPILRPIDRELDRVHAHRFRHLGLEPFPSHVDDGNISTITGTGFAEMHKFSTLQRLPDYAGRATTSLGKLWWLIWSGQLSKILRSRQSPP